MPDTRQRKLAWKMWLASCLVVIFFGATAYLTTDDIMKSTGAELQTVEVVLGKWPQEQALGWWLSLQLDEVQATLVEAIDNGNRTSDPLYWLGEKLNAFLIGCVVNAFHLLFLFFLRVAACCQWAIYCLPLALISLAVGFLQREVNRQTFSVCREIQGAKVVLGAVSWGAVLSLDGVAVCLVCCCLGAGGVAGCSHRRSAKGTLRRGFKGPSCICAKELNGICEPTITLDPGLGSLVCFVGTQHVVQFQDVNRTHERVQLDCEVDKARREAIA